MRIFCGTYAKYNEGNLFGEWLDLEDYQDKDEFLAACFELHADEADPELMFADWEDIPSGLVSECTVSPECWDLLEAFDEHDEGAVKAYVSIWGEWNKSDFEERYRGEYDSWTDLAEQLLDETGELHEIPEHLRNYFDYEAYGRDLRLGGDFCEENGFYFWNS